MSAKSQYMNYRRMPIEVESPEELGYENIKCNLTESSFRDFTFSELGIELKDLVLCYSDHRGNKKLRQQVAQSYGVEADEVLVTLGAAAALFIISTTLLEKGSRLLVLKPNYATNIETPRALGAQIDFHNLSLENGYRIHVDTLISQIKKDTKIVSITNPHNPTGTIITEADLRKLIQATKDAGCLLLVDETYRDLSFQKLPPLAATLADHVISVASLSKAYGLPGIRTGWLVCKNKDLMENFLAAKEQIYITGSVVDEHIASAYLEKKDKFFPQIQATAKEHLQILNAWYSEEKRLKAVPTEGGIVSFPKIIDSRVNIKKFYEVLNNKYKTYVGPGRWFEEEDSSMRIGFAWPTTAELKEGLANISSSLDEASF